MGPMGETLRVKASEAATFSRIEQRIKKDEEYKAKNGSVKSSCHHIIFLEHPRLGEYIDVTIVTQK